MRVSSIKIGQPFKRFAGLTIEDLPATARAVVLVGPNGSGKSSLFDAMLHWAAHAGRGVGIAQPDYYARPGKVFAPGGIEIAFHGELPLNPGKQIHVRSAYRYTPSIRTSSIGHTPPLIDAPVVKSMIDPDETSTRHYQALVGSFVELLSDLDNDRSLHDVREGLRPLAESVNRLFPALRLTSLGSPMHEGSFFFEKHSVKDFRYDNLSSGEKAAFDLLLDLHVTARDFGAGIICLDEPEAHLSPRVQAQLLDEMLDIVPATCQLWLATHSVGLLRRAMQIYGSRSDEIVFLDFGKSDFEEPEILRPVAVDRAFWKDTLEVALDDLAKLVAPETVYLCEGNPEAPADRQSWDAEILREIFGDSYPDVDFVSVGGQAQLKPAAKSFATTVTPGSSVLHVRDRDDLPDGKRTALLKADPSLRILRRRSLESYLIDDEVLGQVVAKYSGKDDGALDELKKSRDAALKSDSDAKPALGALFQAARKLLTQADQLGENAAQFSLYVLAPLVTTGTGTYAQLSEDLGLQNPRP